MSLLNMNTSGTKKLIKYNRLLIKIDNQLNNDKDLDYKFEVNDNAIPIDSTGLSTTPSV